MPGRIFISQAALDAWVSTERVDLQGDVLILRPGGSTLTLVPASVFRSVSGGQDRHGLVGKVKNEAAVAALGAEAYMTSVILGETAYEVDPGFLATPVVNDPAARLALLAAVRQTAGS
jgi:hypothetical protein